MEESYLSNPAQQEDSWTCQHCGWVDPNAHPSAKHRRNHKKHCGKIRGFEQYTERHKGGSSDEASSDDGKDLQHEPDNRYDSAAPVEIRSKVVMAEFSDALQNRDLPLPHDAVTLRKPEPTVHTTSDSVLVKPMASANKSTQNVHATDVVKSECSASEHQTITDSCARTSKTLGDERDAEIEELPCAATNMAPSEVQKEQDCVGLVPDSGGFTVSDSAGILPDQIDHFIERELVLENAVTKQAGKIPSADQLSRTNETKEGVRLPQRLDNPKKGLKYQVADSDKITEIQTEDNINPAQDFLSHQAIGNMGFVDKPPTFWEEEGSVRVGGTEKHLKISQMPDSVQAKERQNREIMTPTANSISREGSLKEDESWKCRHCNWAYPNPHPSAKHRRNHRKNCTKLKGLEGQIMPHKRGSSVEVSSDEEMKEKVHPDNYEVQNQLNVLTTMGTRTALDDQFSFLTVPSTQESSPGSLPDETNVNNFDVDKTYIDSPSEETVPGHREAESAGHEHQKKVLHIDSDEPSLQSLRDIPSSQEIVLDRLSNTSPLLKQSEELSNLGKDIPNASELKANVFGAPHDFTGDSRSNANELPALNVLPSDGFPTDVGSSQSSKSERNGDATLLPPSTHLKASILANQSLKSYGEREIHQNGELEGSQGNLKAAKHSSWTGETSNDEFTDDVPPALGAEKALERESLSERSILVKDAGSVLEMLTNGADNANLKNVLESGKTALNMQGTSHPVNVVAKDDKTNEGLENADLFSKGKIETPKVTEMPALSVDGTSAVEPVSQKTTIPENRRQNDKSSNETPMTMSSSSLSTDFPDKLPLQSDKNYLIVAGSPLDVVTNGAEDVNLKNELENGNNAMNMHATSHPVDILAKDDEINKGLETAHWSSKGRTETPKVTEMLVQSVDSMTSVVDPLSQNTTIPEDRRGDGKRSDKTPTTMAFSSLSTDLPDRLPLQSDDSHLTTSVRNQLVSHIDGAREETCTNDIGGGPPMTEVLPAQSLESKPIEEKSGQNTAAEKDERSTLKNIESKSEAIPERESSVLVEHSLPTITIVNLGNDSALSRSSKESESGQLTLVKEGKEDRGSLVLLEDASPATATVVKMGNDSGPSRSPKESGSSHLSLLKEDNEYTEPSGLVEHPLPTTATVSVANDSNSPKLCKESDLNRLLLLKECSENISISQEWSASPEPLEKLEIIDLGSSGRSLNSFSKADSELSQHSGLAVLSRKLSDSVDIFEDAADTLDACSVGGSVEEGEGLDETPQVSARFQEDSKPLGIASLDEESNHEPHIMSRLTDMPKEELNIMDSKETSKEEKSRPTSHSLSSRMEELRAPSPEAWQEAGPSTLKKQGAKRPTSEVTEDRKSSESHSALRRLMAEEEADKVNEATPNAVDPKALLVQEPPANGSRRKPKSRSFWSHCICCPAVH